MANLNDQRAGELLAGLRQRKGLSPEEVPAAMVAANIEFRAIPSGRTIRRVEEGTRPCVRYQFGLAAFYGLDVAQTWPRVSRSRRPRRSRMAVAA